MGVQRIGLSEKTRAEFALQTAKNEFSVVDLGMSFIIY